MWFIVFYVLLELFLISFSEVPSGGLSRTLQAEVKLHPTLNIIILFWLFGKESIIDLSAGYGMPPSSESM